MRNSFGISNGYAPKEGPKCVPVDLDFTNVAIIDSDLLLEEQQGVISFVQSVFVDNSLNVNELTLLFSVTGQKIVIPAQAQGMWPVIAVEQLQFRAASVQGTVGAGGAGIPRIIFLNVPMPLTQWGPIAVAATLALTRGVFTDYSGTIAAGGVSQSAIAANALRKRFIIQNPSSEIESLWINFTGAANAGQPSFELLPGGSIDSNFGPVTTEEITVFALTTGHTFTAKEM